MHLLGRNTEAGGLRMSRIRIAIFLSVLLLLVTQSATIGTSSAQGGDRVIYLPTVLRERAAYTAFGIESSNLTNSSAGIAASGARWVRKNALVWRDVEPAEGQRNWGAVAALDAQLGAARAAGLQTILIVRGTPDWAQKVADKACGPIREDKLPAFAAFMRDAVLRYSRLLYGVLHWEFWNEPDVDAALVPGGSPFGCYGDASDEYYGGGAYAQMLKAVYPVVKDAAPAAQVVMGGLLMDCDPENLSLACNNVQGDEEKTEQKRRVGRFFEGVLRAGGGSYFDIGNFHSYDRYTNPNSPGQYSNLSWGNTNADGPVLLRKYAYLRSLLEKYGVGDKPMMNTETAVICAGRNNPCGVAPNENIQLANAYYIAQSYAAAHALNLQANIHYSYEGWNGTNMISGTQKLAPYTAFVVASQRIGGAAYVGPITADDVGVSGIAGYKFMKNAKKLWVVWSIDGTERVVNVSGAPVFIDALGAAAANPIGYKPVYIEWQ